MRGVNLRERVAFDAPTSEDDGFGGSEISFAEGSDLRAHFKFLRSGETVVAARLAARQVIAVTVRSNSVTRTIAPDWRMRDRNTGKVYNVKGMEPLEDRAWLEVLVEGGEVV